MELALTKDICFFDVESTGLNVIRDRIIQIAIVKLKVNNPVPEEICLLINPGIPISEEAMKVHGITPKDLANKPTFQQVAQKIFDFIGNSDLGGYNCNKFDIPILMEEFARVGLEFHVDQRKVIDVQRIFYKMEPRTLKAAVKFYCGRDFGEAHDALHDVRATIEVLKGQLDRYQGVDELDDEGNILGKPVVNDVAVLHDFTNDLKTIDATQRLKFDDSGNIVFNFGKYQGQVVSKVFATDKNYYNWIMTMEFSHQVKQIVKKIYKDNCV